MADGTEMTRTGLEMAWFDDLATCDLMVVV